MLKIYLISSELDGNKVYKIGYTKRDINERVKEFKTGNSNNLTIESFFTSKWAKKIEKGLHRHFKNYKISGEWFKLESHHLVDFLRICQITHDNLELLDKYNTWIEDRGGLNKIKL